MDETLTRHIWGYWHQGRDYAPRHVHECWDLWRRMNPGWTVNILEWADVAEMFDEKGINAKNLSITAIADIVRISLLAKRGGVWVDSYTVPLKPLQKWLPNLATHGFFAFHDPYRGRLAENWFLYANPAHPLAVAWHDHMVDYWQMPRRPMRNRHELDQGAKGEVTRFWGRLADRFEIPPSERSRKRIYTPKSSQWAVAPEGGAAHPIFPYFFMAMTFDSMLMENSNLKEEWLDCPKITSYDSLLLRHWANRYDELTAANVQNMCSGKAMQKLMLPKPLPDYLWRALTDLAETTISSN
jgi:hypothetical protein